MAIRDVMRTLRVMKDEGSLTDFMVYGSVAAMVHTRPFYTKDVDIAVVVDSDEEYRAVLRRLSDFGTINGFAVEIGGTIAEIFPDDISPIIHDAVNHALRRKVEGSFVKIAPPEHLLLEALRAGRVDDQARVLILNDVIDRRRLSALFRKLDSNGTLRRDYKRITGKTP